MGEEGTARGPRRAVPDKRFRRTHSGLAIDCQRGRRAAEALRVRSSNGGWSEGRERQHFAIGDIAQVGHDAGDAAVGGERGIPCRTNLVSSDIG